MKLRRFDCLRLSTVFWSKSGTVWTDAGWFSRQPKLIAASLNSPLPWFSVVNDHSPKSILVLLWSDAAADSWLSKRIAAPLQGALS